MIEQSPGSASGTRLESCVAVMGYLSHVNGDADFGASDDRVARSPATSVSILIHVLP